MQIGTECYHHLKKIIKKKFGKQHLHDSYTFPFREKSPPGFTPQFLKGGDATLIGDEGGFAPPCDARGGVELVMEAISSAGYEGKCTIGECLGRLLPRFKRLPVAPDG